ncbi:hypothetical protein M0811_06838 [Anaeramoeba ignava]|uniref:Uncharacterized protein n=1 Tax=Anaeramoeba ignava TaxID=1746090 RepID=A0A9Q0LNR4_ANAIG|nr:hypothetical protein M0811_06838 [Anaeramoeba ignava]
MRFIFYFILLLLFVQSIFTTTFCCVYRQSTECQTLCTDHGCITDPYKVLGVLSGFVVVGEINTIRNCSQCDSFWQNQDICQL